MGASLSPDTIQARRLIVRQCHLQFSLAFVAVDLTVFSSSITLPQKEKQGRSHTAEELTGNERTD